MNIYEHGHWDGDRFIFNEPVTLPDGHVMQSIDLSQVQGLEDSGISREDVVHAMLNAYAVEPATELGDQFTTWHNPSKPMTPEEAEDFFEEDEDPREVFAAFDRGIKGKTAPPDPDKADYVLVDLPCGCQDVHYADGRIDYEHDHVECDGRRDSDLANYEYYLDPEHLKPAGPGRRRKARRSADSLPDAPETSESPPQEELPSEE